MWQHLCVCVCLCLLLGYLHVPLVRRSATAATATATTAAGRRIVLGKGEWGNGERGTVVDPQVLTLAPKCFWIKYIYKSDKIATSNTKKTSSESCEMHLLLKLISTLGLSWVSAQHEMPEFVGGCASAFNQLQICKYLLNWLTLSVERFFVLNLKKVPPHATVQRGRNSKSFAILPQPRPKKPQEFRSTQQWKTAVIWQWLTVALCLSLFLSLSVYQFN